MGQQLEDGRTLSTTYENRWLRNYYYYYYYYYCYHFYHFYHYYQ